MSAQNSIIKIESVTKQFGAFKAINNVSLDIERGSFTTLLGPSGCGKTTLMRLIAGFHEPDSGSIYIEGNKVNGTPVYKRNTPLVFQEYALFPHMTVFENIAYGLKLKRIPSNEIKEKVGTMLDMFGLQGMEHRYPKQMSGGQQQRVAFARALIIGQNILLMDEPLSNLDAKMRVEVRNDIREMQQRAGITAIFVTHDQDEALSLSDRIAVFNKGTIYQVGTPWEVYFKPNNKFVADFVGVANFVDGEVVGVESQDYMVKCADIAIKVDKTGYSAKLGDKVTLVIRPECISVLPREGSYGSSDNVWSGYITRSSFLGRMIRYWAEAGSMQWIIDDSSPSVRGYLEGQIDLVVDKKKIHMLIGEQS
ncbi:ABC transporter ATP-binding protein [Paenibacillus radicis (ex Xue et al. 2023)]|uniref:ABC transporter ATP-binding protein n=1 Tax=Paenibacillus radicis (ex Xue et al. 2023) TaxID=2972489 RepID=A0ABT1YA65_9BACL|nr:ABC transporter ATP-binding protein [Paenibacillus radicis (ex Xue et al. 2023)]MCR8630067.1 ABC transporter ATP-binding protein [Paenibacillus radicis (ex Xue et al. 2023)]